MVDFEIFCAGANGASAVLSRVQRLDVGQREGAAVGGLARPAPVHANAIHLSRAFRVSKSPSPDGGGYFVHVSRGPFSAGRTMAGRILGAALSGPFRFKARAMGNPAAPLVGVALYAHTIRNVAQRSMSALARLSGCPMFLASGFGGGAGRMPRALSHGSKRRLACADGTGASVDATLGDVSVLARLAREVEVLAASYCGGSVRIWRRHVSPTLMGMIAPVFVERIAR